jgi:uroporphyrinogen III methyltransferase/synthase
VESLVVYTSRDVRAPEPEVVRLMEAGKIDWVTVTSSAIARSLVAMFGDRLGACRLASISPVTSRTLRQLGREVTAEAAEYTMAGLVAAIVQAQCDR